MGNKFSCRKATISDVFAIVNKLRQEDIEELAINNKTPLVSLLEGYIFSPECYACVINNTTVVGLFGIAQHLNNTGMNTIWYLGTDDITLVPIQWVKTSKIILNKWIKKYGVLTNFIYLKNSLHINWLKKMGAIFSAPIGSFKQFFIIEEIK